MDFLKNFSVILFVVVLSGLVYGGIFWFAYEDSKVCDELVILNDGSQIEVTSVSSYRNGMSTIKMCNGQWMDTPTINIKMVKPLNK